MLVDADKLCKKFCSHCTKYPCDSDCFDIKIIKSMPEALVRCKDCKWYRESVLLEPNQFCYRLKDRYGQPIGYNWSDDDFCSHGERKEQNDE